MYLNGRNITFIDRNNSSVNMFLREARKHTPLTTDKEYELWCKMRQGSRHAKDQLINANLRYVVTIAKKYLASGTPFEDLLMAQVRLARRTHQCRRLRCTLVGRLSARLVRLLLRLAGTLRQRPHCLEEWTGQALLSGLWQHARRLPYHESEGLHPFRLRHQTPSVRNADAAFPPHVTP